ncbi:Hsp70 family protein [Streptococcus suis]|uniref:Hsp70 family protein n=1 Tax=Streptococcus suis TaxID=1307 RepID=UPI000CF65D3B|nr:Hsp70 family protein [Streptococcus suis]
MIIGIDLGTTNSLVATWRNNKVELIPNNLGDFLTPSVVGLSDNGDIIVGKFAKERLMSHPHLTQSRFKRLMGTGKKLPLGDQMYLPEELSAFILKKLIEDAEEFLGEKVDEIIVSVPAYFSDDQRAATKIAGHLAGVKIERIINEPSAAALALHHSREEDATYMIIDFGGGTLDISIVDAFANVIEIVSVAGENHLGGEDFTQQIVEDFIQNLPYKKSDLSDEVMGFLYQEAEKAKLALNKEDSVRMSVNINDSLHVYKLTKERYVEICRFLLAKMNAPIQNALRDAQIHAEDLTDVILVGGSTKMKLIQDYLIFLLKRPISVKVDQDKAVAMGCGIVTGIKKRDKGIKDVVLTDICPFTLGTAIVGNVFSPIIERNTTLPASYVERYWTNELGQQHVLFTIYQGENYQADTNLLLGSLDIPIPVNHEEHEAIDCRFSYDINGILDVDITVLSTGKVYNKTILRDRQQLSAEEILEKRAKLASLKIHPRDSEHYQLLRARAERLFRTLLAEQRYYLMNCIQRYEKVIETQDAKRIAKANKIFENQLDGLEESW